MKKALFLALLPLLALSLCACNDKTPEMSGSKWSSETAMQNGDINSSALTFNDKTVTEIIQIYSNSTLVKTSTHQGEYIAEDSKIQILWAGKSDIEVFSRINKSKKSSISTERTNEAGSMTSYIWNLQ